LKNFLTGFLLLVNSYVFSQEILSHTYQSTGALVSYYFWEEDSNSFIINNEIDKPYVQNYNIIISTKNKHKHSVSTPELSAIIARFSYVKTAKKEKNYFKIQKEKKKIAIHYPLIRTEAENLGSIIYIKKNEQWKSQSFSCVNYFTVTADNEWKHSHSNDSIILPKNDLTIRSNGQFLVITYLMKNGEIDKHKVFSYAGTDVTDYILEKKTMLSQRVLVFANGYRGPTSNKYQSDHLVTNKNRYFYWFKVDDQFIERLKPSESFYIDGSMGINTSNHKTFTGFVVSFFRSRLVFRKNWSKKKFESLNSSTNIEGFQKRKDRGRIAGKAFLTALCNSPACQNTKDTIDIVCHSMGYAYALGFIEEIKTKVTFGNMYVLAAEAACYDGADWSQFQQVWQYGSNLDQPNPDPIWEQDGVAPQCQVKGLEVMSPGKGGRAFIPKDWPRKNFIDSHQPYNFYWIFERILPGENGYIGK